MLNLISILRIKSNNCYFKQLKKKERQKFLPSKLAEDAAYLFTDFR